MSVCMSEAKLSDIVVCGFGNRIRNTANNATENLMFFSTEELISELQTAPILPIKATIMTELLVRYYFNSTNQTLSSFLKQTLAEEPFSRFNAWKRDNYWDSKPTSISLVSETDLLLCDKQEWLKSVQNQTFARFEQLFANCDGIIPVIVENRFGFCIPFSLVKMESEEPISSEHIVTDLDNVPFPEWSKAVEALQLRGNYQVRLLFHSQYANIGKFTGYSLQFSVLMAYWRKNSLLPKYSPFFVVATGKITDGRLRPVKGEEKFCYLKNRFDKVLFLCSELSHVSSDSTLDSDSQVISIPDNIETSQLLTYCQQQLEFVSKKMSDGSQYILFDMDYIGKRMDCLYTCVKEDLKSSWNEILEILEHIHQQIRPYTQPKLYLKSLMTRSFAMCHSGLTQEAFQLNKEGTELATKENCTDILHEFFIHQLVLLQDSEDLSPTLELAETIEHELSLRNQTEKKTLELKMCFHGTMSQVHLFGTVCGLDGYKKNLAIEHAKTAIRFANKLGKEDEIIRDMNYLHLCDAFFIPGSEQENKDFYDAKNQLRTSKNNITEEEYGVNLQFQFRQRCLAGYRQILTENKCRNLQLAYEPYPNVQSPFDWLLATSLKYQGAVATFKGDTSQAETLFKQAWDSLESAKAPLIKYIRMTIATEAYRSFSIVGNADLAEIYRNNAKLLFEQNDNFESYFTATAWKDFIDTPWEEFQKSGKPFPGIYYYY